MAIEVISNDPKESSSAQAEATAESKESRALHPEDNQSESTEETQGDESESVEASDTSKKEEEIEASNESQDEEESQSDEDEESEEDEDPSEEKAKEKGKVPKGVKRRFKRYQRKLSEKDQEIEYWRREALKQKQAPEAKEAENLSQTDQVQNDEPQVDDFDDHIEYVKAYAKWTVAQEKLKDEAKNREVQAKTEYQKELDTHNQRVKGFKEKQSDYDEVIKNFLDEHGDEGGEFFFSPGFTEVVKKNEEGPALIYELAKQPEELLRINSLSPIAAAFELGKSVTRIAGSSSKPQTTQTKTTTKAPPPPTPVGRKSDKPVFKSIYDEGISQAEFERLIMEQEKDKWGA